MRTIQLRKVGQLDVSVIGLGCNNFGGRIGQERTNEVVGACLDAGINFFDTADVYGGTQSEQMLGRALGPHRGEVIVATKFGIRIDDEHKGASPAYVKAALEASLARLGTDYVDLYQLHRPDPDVPIGDTLEALGQLVSEGKVREIGCSNFSAAELREADDAVAQGAPRFASVQNEYNLLHREPELEVLGECRRLGMAFIPYYPLMMGLLSGKFHRGEAPLAGTRIAGLAPERQDTLFAGGQWDVIEQLTSFAKGHGHSLLELAFAWLAAQPTVASVIAGATSAQQVHANAAASGWVLDDGELAEVAKIAPPPNPAP